MVIRLPEPINIPQTLLHESKVSPEYLISDLSDQFLVVSIMACGTYRALHYFDLTDNTDSCIQGSPWLNFLYK